MTKSQMFVKAHKRVKFLRFKKYEFNYHTQLGIELKNIHRENKMSIEKNISHSFYRHSQMMNKSEFINTFIRNWQNKRLYINIVGTQGFKTSVYINLDDKELYIAAPIKNRLYRAAMNEAVQVIKENLNQILGGF